MVINDIDEILFWDELPKLYSFIKELDAKFYPHSPDEFYKEKKNFYIKEIGSKDNFMQRINKYHINGAPIWTGGRNQNCDDLSIDDIKLSIFNSTNENGKKRFEKYISSKNSWAVHSDYYSKQINYKNELAILELSVGAGTGTCCALESLSDGSTFVGVDIDFRCAKTADGIANYLNKNACGITGNFWNMPFSDNTFDVICSHGGIGECREIPVIISEAQRMLRPNGRLVICERMSGYIRHKELFELFEIEESEALQLLDRARLYSDINSLENICKDNNLHKVDYKVFSTNNRYVYCFSK